MAQEPSTAAQVAFIRQTRARMTPDQVAATVAHFEARLTCYESLSKASTETRAWHRDIQRCRICLDTWRDAQTAQQRGEPINGVKAGELGRLDMLAYRLALLES